MSELLALPAPAAAPAAGIRARPARRSWKAQVNLVVEVVTGGLVELWAHKLRS
ncbi:MAG: hypothetical protein JOZ15_13895, partial [Acidobacteria bacterium]|nr:hypothetical protein [Acidobacteriota bacterium]